MWIQDMFFGERRFLYVDNDPAGIDTLQSLLVKCGHKSAMHAHSLEQAFDCLKAAGF